MGRLDPQILDKRLRPCTEAGVHECLQTLREVAWGVECGSTDVDVHHKLLVGWPDGRVEAVFEGTRELVEEAISWCRQGNPPAVVKDVAVEYETPEGLRRFEIRR